MQTPRSDEPVWQPSRAVDYLRLPRDLVAWLLDRASLTHRVQRSCAGTFRVEVLYQGWQRPQRHERLALNLRRRTLTMVREVRLLCDEQPWVYARSVVPLRTLSGAQRRLGELGSRPLGALLFTDRSLERGELELARIRPGQRLFAAATAGVRPAPAEIWGRRSIFRIGGKPLLVQELFLPALHRCRTPARR